MTMSRNMPFEATLERLPNASNMFSHVTPPTELPTNLLSGDHVKAVILALATLFVMLPSASYSYVVLPTWVYWFRLLTV